eukprot:TRINITY_DN2545_c0_g2_i1.p1 TRINITY_DN2545_c0_g2~~TRINITY_DN2545_c0_g2_i1.p1  ORF type:complete len:3474 (+),score=839.80 TRINITY_DN2545_c0_g2_i1:75-10424(+)
MATPRREDGPRRQDAGRQRRPVFQVTSEGDDGLSLSIPTGAVEVEAPEVALLPPAVASRDRLSGQLPGTFGRPAFKQGPRSTELDTSGRGVRSASRSSDISGEALQHLGTGTGRTSPCLPSFGSGARDRPSGLLQPSDTASHLELSMQQMVAATTVRRSPSIRSSPSLRSHSVRSSVACSEEYGELDLCPGGLPLQEEDEDDVDDEIVPEPLYRFGDTSDTQLVLLAENCMCLWRAGDNSAPWVANLTGPDITRSYCAGEGAAGGSDRAVWIVGLHPATPYLLEVRSGGESENWLGIGVETPARQLLHRLCARGENFVSINWVREPNPDLPLFPEESAAPDDDEQLMMSSRRKQSTMVGEDPSTAYHIVSAPSWNEFSCVELALWDVVDIGAQHRITSGMRGGHGRRETRDRRDTSRSARRSTGGRQRSTQGYSTTLSLQDVAGLSTGQKWRLGSGSAVLCKDTPGVVCGLPPAREFVVRLRGCIRVPGVLSPPEGAKVLRGVWCDWAAVATLAPLQLRLLQRGRHVLVVAWGRRRIAGDLLPKSWYVDGSDDPGNSGVKSYSVSLTANWTDNPTRRERMQKEIGELDARIQQEATSSESSDYSEDDEKAAHRSRRADREKRVASKELLERALQEQAGLEVFCDRKQTLAVKDKYQVYESLDPNTVYRVQVTPLGDTSALLGQEAQLGVRTAPSAQRDKINLDPSHIEAQYNRVFGLLSADAPEAEVEIAEGAIAGHGGLAKHRSIRRQQTRGSTGVGDTDDEDMDDASGYYTGADGDDLMDPQAVVEDPVLLINPAAFVTIEELKENAVMLSWRSTDAEREAELRKRIDEIQAALAAAEEEAEEALRMAEDSGSEYEEVEEWEETDDGEDSSSDDAEVTQVAARRFAEDDDDEDEDGGYALGGGEQDAPEPGKRKKKYRRVIVRRKSADDWMAKVNPDDFRATSFCAPEDDIDQEELLEELTAELEEIEKVNKLYDELVSRGLKHEYMIHVYELQPGEQMPPEKWLSELPAHRGRCSTQRNDDRRASEDRIQHMEREQRRARRALKRGKSSGSLAGEVGRPLSEDLAAANEPERSPGMLKVATVARLRSTSVQDAGTATALIGTSVETDGQGAFWLSHRSAEFSAVFPGLRPGKRYCIRMTCLALAGAGGWHEFSEVCSFCTPSASACYVSHLQLEPEDPRTVYVLPVLSRLEREEIKCGQRKLPRHARPAYAKNSYQVQVRNLTKQSTQSFYFTNDDLEVAPMGGAQQKGPQRGGAQEYFRKRGIKVRPDESIVGFPLEVIDGNTRYAVRMRQRLPGWYTEADSILPTPAGTVPEQSSAPTEGPAPPAEELRPAPEWGSWGQEVYITASFIPVSVTDIGEGWLTVQWRLPGVDQPNQLVTPPQPDITTTMVPPKVEQKRKKKVRLGERRNVSRIKKHDVAGRQHTEDEELPRLQSDGLEACVPVAAFTSRDRLLQPPSAAAEQNALLEGADFGDEIETESSSTSEEDEQAPSEECSDEDAHHSVGGGSQAARYLASHMVRIYSATTAWSWAIWMPENAPADGLMSHTFEHLGYDRYRITLLRTEYFSTDEDAAQQATRFFWKDQFAPVALVRRFDPVLIRVGENYAELFCIQNEDEDSPAAKVGTGVAKRKTLDVGKLEPSARHALCRHHDAHEALGIAGGKGDQSAAAKDIQLFDVLLSNLTTGRARATPADDGSVPPDAGQGGAGSSHVTFVPSASLSGSISDLEPECLYSITIRPQLINGGKLHWGQWSETIRFRTQSLITLRLDTVGEDFVCVQWHRPFPYGDIAPEITFQEHVQRMVTRREGRRTAMEAAQAEEEKKESTKPALQRGRSMVRAGRKSSTVPQGSSADPQSSPPQQHVSAPPPRPVAASPASPPGGPAVTVTDGAELMDAAEDRFSYLDRIYDVAFQFDLVMFHDHASVDLDKITPQRLLQLAAGQVPTVAELGALGRAPTGAPTAPREEASDSPRGQGVEMQTRGLAVGPQRRTLKPQETSYTFRNLESGARYKIRVRQGRVAQPRPDKGAEDWGLWSNCIAMWTVPPLKVSVEEVGEESCRLVCVRGVDVVGAMEKLFPTRVEQDCSATNILRGDDSLITALQVRLVEHYTAGYGYQFHDPVTPSVEWAHTTVPLVEQERLWCEHIAVTQVQLAQEAAAGRHRRSHGSGAVDAAAVPRLSAASGDQNLSDTGAGSESCEVRQASPRSDGTAPGGAQAKEKEGEKEKEKEKEKEPSALPPFYRDTCDMTRVPIEGGPKLPFDASRVINLVPSVEGTYTITGFLNLAIYAVQARARIADRHNGRWSKLSAFQTMSRLRMSVDKTAESYAVVSWSRLRTMYDEEAEQSTAVGAPHYSAAARLQRYQLEIQGMLPQGGPAAGLSDDPELVTVDSMPGLAWKDQLVLVHFTPDVRIHTMQNLLPDALYTVRVRSFHPGVLGGTWSQWSEECVFATLPPLDIAIKSLGSTFACVDVSRKEPREEAYIDAEDEGDLSFDVLVLDTNSDEWIRFQTTSDQRFIAEESTPPVFVTPTDDPSRMIVRGLSPSRRYAALARARVQMQDESGAVTSVWGRWSGIRSFETLGALAAHVLEIAEVQCKVQIVRSPAAAGEDVIVPTRYQVAVNAKMSQDELDLPEGSNTVVTLSGLAINTNYMVAVRAEVRINSWGEPEFDDWHQLLSVHTTPQRPTVPVLYEHRKGWMAFFWKIEQEGDLQMFNAEIDDRFPVYPPAANTEAAGSGAAGAAGSGFPSPAVGSPVGSPRSPPQPRVQAAASAWEQKLREAHQAAVAAALRGGDTASRDTELQFEPLSSYALFCRRHLLDVVDPPSAYDPSRKADKDDPEVKSLGEQVPIDDLGRPLQRRHVRVRHSEENPDAGPGAPVPPPAELGGAEEWSRFSYRIEACRRIEDAGTGVWQFDANSLASEWTSVCVVPSPFVRLQLTQPLDCYMFRIRAQAENKASRRPGQPQPPPLVSRPSPWFSFQAPPPPEQPVSCEVLDIRHSSALLRWGPPPDLPLHNQVWYAVYLLRVGVEDEWTEVARVRTTGYFLTSLCIGSSYQAAVRTVSTFGRSPPSTFLQFSTAGLVTTTDGAFAPPALNDPRAVWRPADHDWLYPNPLHMDATPPRLPTPFHLYQVGGPRHYSAPVEAADPARQLLRLRWAHSAVLPALGRPIWSPLRGQEDQRKRGRPRAHSTFAASPQNDDDDDPFGSPLNAGWGMRPATAPVTQPRNRRAGGPGRRGGQGKGGGARPQSAMLGRVPRPPRNASWAPGGDGPPRPSSAGASRGSLLFLGSGTMWGKGGDDDSEGTPGPPPLIPRAAARQRRRAQAMEPGAAVPDGARSPRTPSPWTTAAAAAAADQDSEPAVLDPKEIHLPPAALQPASGTRRKGSPRNSRTPSAGTPGTTPTNKSRVGKLPPGMRKPLPPAKRGRAPAPRRSSENAPANIPGEWDTPAVLVSPQPDAP